MSSRFSFFNIQNVLLKCHFWLNKWGMTIFYLIIKPNLCSSHFSDHLSVVMGFLLSNLFITRVESSSNPRETELFVSANLDPSQVTNWRLSKNYHSDSRCRLNSKLVPILVHTSIMNTHLLTHTKGRYVSIGCHVPYLPSVLKQYE